MNKSKYRKGIFAVVYCQNKKGDLNYAIFKRKKHWKGWEFPKGKIESGETKVQTTKREILEETGLEATKIKSFGIEGKYKYGKIFMDRPNIIGQTFELFSAEVPFERIKIDKKEHYGGDWFSYKDSLKKLTWPNQRRCLRIVNSWLNKKK